ncbi:MAG: hypothetical protein ACM30G_22625, partial [Micromonosporaceae bacterium]
GAGPGTSAPTTAGSAQPTDPPSSEPPATGEYRVTYGFAVPSGRISIDHTYQIPIAPAPAPPLPYLVGIYAGDHPEATPKYARMSFYFRGTFPSYNFEYVPEVISEGKGDTIPLEGNAFIRLGFVNAQAHDNNGAPTVKASPASHIGFGNLKSYGFAGDFEGHVTYGLGIQVAPGSDQVLALRTGELKKPDGAGGFYYVVHIDVQYG